MTRILGFDTHDIRFPTSRTLDGSDAMNPSAAITRRPRWWCAPTTPDRAVRACARFTLGRGNDIQLGAVRALEPYLAGRDVDETIADLGGLARELVGDSPLRWLGPPAASCTWRSARC